MVNNFCMMAGGPRLTMTDTDVGERTARTHGRSGPCLSTAKIIFFLEHNNGIKDFFPY